jgi:hypothetical protein
MSKVKIQGNASGTGVVTLTAPNTNTDRTITLPDEDITLGVDATKLPLSGGTMTGTTVHGDNVKATYGTGNDLEIYHDGSYSRIKDVGTGSLVISGNEINFNNAANVTNLLSIKDDGRGLSQFTAKAWCQFEANATPAIVDSHNCSSITDIATGRYSINLTNTLGAKPAVALSNQAAQNNDEYVQCIHTDSTASLIRIQAYRASTQQLVDTYYVHAIAFGD